MTEPTERDHALEAEFERRFLALGLHGALADRRKLMIEAIAAAREEGRREAIKECRRRFDIRINDLLNETWPDHDDSIVGINQAWAVADALFEEMK